MAKTLRDNRLNRITYISLGGAIAAIIIFLIAFNVINNAHKKENLQIGDNKAKEIEVEEANFDLGKTVEQAKETEEGENVQVQIKDDSQVNGELSEELNNEEVAEQTNSIENSVDAVDVANTTNEVNSAKVNTQENEVKEETKDLSFSMPVDGEIVKHYGKEKLIYSDTLKEWTTHLGIDIKADKTTVVKAAADGTVKSIKNDPRYGLTVVLEHQNGFTSVYANLLTAEFVSQGENIKTGQTLGTVGNSATFEIVDDPHLHFEILKDGNSIDPEMYIK